MEISADILNRKSINTEIDHSIKLIIRAITEKILEAHANSQYETTFELPTVFHIQEIELVDLQILIYGRVLEKLEEKGFKVKFRSSDKDPLFVIQWATAIDPIEKLRLKNLLLSRISDGGVAGPNGKK